MERCDNCFKLKKQHRSDILVERSRLNDERKRLRKAVTLWQGKFHALRHENNKLRRALEARKEEA